MVRTKNHQLLRKGLNSKPQLFDCSKAYAVTIIPPKDYTAEDKAAYEKLSKIIMEKDKLHHSEIRHVKK